MKKINLDSKVIIKLNEKGKHLYYLSVLNDEMANSVLEPDGSLIATLEEVIGLLGSTYSGFTPIVDAIASDKLYLVDEEKVISLDAMIIIQLSDFGKQLFYLNIMDGKIPTNRLTKDDYLFASIRELIKIYGGNLEALPFERDEIIINEQVLLDYNENVIENKNR